MNRSTLIRNLFIATLLTFTIGACGDSKSDHEDLNCVTFQADNAGGEACGGGDDCPAVACPCADGSTVTTRSCFNGYCEGESACASACAPNEYLCQEPVGNDDEPDAGHQSDTHNDDSPAKSCVQDSEVKQVYDDEQSCVDAGGNVVKAECGQYCQQYFSNPNQYASCANGPRGESACPNENADSASACTDSIYCAWIVQCEESVACTDLSNQSDCSQQTTCAWR